MSGGGGIIIIQGNDANGQTGNQYTCGVASAEAALAVLEASPAPDTNFITALRNAISDAND